MTRIIAELGSCHLGREDIGRELIDEAAKAGCWAVKFQLFPDNEMYVAKAGNIWLDPLLYLKLQDYARSKGLLCGASAFDERNFEFLLNEAKPDFYKFAFSKKAEKQQINIAVATGKPVFVSCDIMTQHLVPRGATTLYCIPEYPIRYDVSFLGIFPRFSGFSDHTLGSGQSVLAIYNGADYLEKHMKLERQLTECPDALFAINPKEMTFICSTGSFEIGAPFDEVLH
jgi:sialic acid synthase SpsE